MGFAARKIKFLLLRFLQSPMKTSGEIGRRVFSRGRKSAQVARLQEITRQAPLILQIETTNICNARCVFCAYPGMKRPKGVMSMPLFEKIVTDYAMMGGGPVSLTPVVGDALVDPHLLERLCLLEACNEIRQVSLTTNGIALERYADEEVRTLLKTLDCIQVSIGGLDAETYRTLYGVDKFNQVQQAMERLMQLKETVPEPANISFAFRTNDWKFELRFRKQLAEYRRQGIFVSHIWTYANYSGMVDSDPRLKLDVMQGSANKCETCVYAGVHMAVCWDGRITACGCADFEGNSLSIGHAEKDALADVWFGQKRAGILTSFAAGKYPGICRDCSAYQPESLIYSSPYCRDIHPRQPLPLEYFRQFWGG